jgi:hypothetical protein
LYDLFCLFKDAFGHWSGIVGELVRHEADIGVASLTISSVRQKAVDFSTPFMNLGISIMVYKQKQAVIISLFYIYSQNSLTLFGTVKIFFIQIISNSIIDN